MPRQLPMTNYHDLNLDWILNQVKTMIAEWQVTRGEFVDLQADWETEKSWFENYITEHYEEDMIAYMNSLIANGTFLQVITPQVNAQTQVATDIWLAGHISQETGYVLDDSLTSTEAAAQAKAVGDTFNDVFSSLDLIEVVPDNSQVYNTSASSITVGFPSTTLADTKSGYIACNPGDMFSVTMYGSSSQNYLPWAFVDENGAFILKCSTLQHNMTKKLIIAPEGAAYFIINANVSYNCRVYKGLTQYNHYMLENIKAVTDKGGSINIDPWNYLQMMKTISNTNSLTSSGNKYRSAFVSIENSWGSIEVTANSEHAGIVTFLTAIPANSATSITSLLAYGETGRRIVASNETQKFDIPVNAKYMAVTLVSSAADSNFTPTIKVYGKSLWQGLRVSLLGDSFSALGGYIPTGNGAYYNNGGSDPSNSGITKPDEMWWGQTISAMGAKPLIIDAWTGSCVTDGVRTGRTAMVDSSRCQNLHAYMQTTSDNPNALHVVESDPGTGEVAITGMRVSPFDEAYTPAVGDYVLRIDPDIVIIEGGTNDYTYINSADLFGTYTGHTQLDTTDITHFRSAYANMLNRIHAEYPNALIICLSGMFCIRPYTANSQTNRNSDSGKTMRDYNLAIEEIASLHQGAYIDCYMEGFNRWNYYDTFSSDRDTSTTHPNMTGHQTIAQNLVAKLKSTCVGYCNWLRHSHN